MGNFERKEREKELLRRLIIDTAHEILAKDGLEALTMRGISHIIEYSQSKIYEFFKSKDELCEVLCEDLCKQLLEVLKKISKDLSPEKYLTEILMKTIEFHSIHTHSDELFTLVCFAPERFKIPSAYFDMVKFPYDAVRRLKSPYIKNDHQILVALDIMRCFKIGLAKLMASDTSLSGKKRVFSLAEETIEVLLRGWK